MGGELVEANIDPDLVIENTNPITGVGVRLEVTLDFVTFYAKDKQILELEAKQESANCTFSFPYDTTPHMYLHFRCRICIVEYDDQKVINTSEDVANAIVRFQAHNCAYCLSRQ